MARVNFKQLWDNHPGKADVCSSDFINQCAIRMSEALQKTGIDLASFNTMFPGRRCYPGHGHSGRHVLAAQELADWIVAQPHLFGTVEKVTTRVTHADYASRKGIVFVQNGWGYTDHIDVWDSKAMKGGYPEYFARGKALWFWDL